jgi:hypothetical protein
MASLSAKDRVSLGSFTFSDGRRCRTPRIAKHPCFCSYHAQKETRARTARRLGKDLAYFFSGDEGRKTPGRNHSRPKNKGLSAGNGP